MGIPFSKFVVFSAVFLTFASPDIVYAQASQQAPSQNFDFKQCMNKASLVGEDASADCMRQENMRIEQLIYAEYENILNDENFKEWNENGTMFRGKLRSLYETWKAYRDTFCSLYAFSMDGYLGSEQYNTSSSPKQNFYPRLKLKLVPLPTDVSTLILVFIKSAIFLTMAKPNPAPWRLFSGFWPL